MVLSFATEVTKPHPKTPFSLSKAVTYHKFSIHSFADSTNVLSVFYSAGSVVSNEDDAKMNRTVDPTLEKSIRGQAYE